MSKILIYQVDLFPALVLEHAPLEAVYIYFDTATYDEIERDEKVTFQIDYFKTCSWHHVKKKKTILTS